jgi:hypothetical protein
MMYQKVNFYLISSGNIYGVNFFKYKNEVSMNITTMDYLAIIESIQKSNDLLSDGCIKT